MEILDLLLQAASLAVGLCALAAPRRPAYRRGRARAARPARLWHKSEGR